MKEVKRVKCPNNNLEVIILTDGTHYTKRVIIPADILLKVRRVPCGKCDRDKCIATTPIKELLKEKDEVEVQ